MAIVIRSNSGMIAQMGKVKLWGYRCLRCGHEWLPRDKTRDPRVCPKCKSPYWDKPRKNGSGSTDENDGRLQAKEPDE